MSSAPSQLTELLHQWSDGDREALDHLVPLVYERLRRLAHQRLRNEPVDQSLNTTALVHEAYLKLAASPAAPLRDRSHFMALASRIMRHLLVDHARARQAAKRGGGMERGTIEELVWMSDEDVTAIADLDRALQRLRVEDARQSEMLEQRYFGGLTLEEVAATTGTSLATVKRELRSARAWLAVELSKRSASSARRGLAGGDP